MTATGVDVAFWGFAVAAVWFGWRVFRTDSMVRATFSLLLSFVNVGAILLLLLAEYLGAALFFMMTVEMTVMALFMVAFMMNPAGLNPMQMVHQHRASIAVGAGVAVGLGVLAVLGTWPDRQLVDAPAVLEQLGHHLMGDAMLVMQTIGLTILTGMVGAVVLSSHRGRSGDAVAGSVPPSLDPEGEQPAEPRPTDDGHGGHGGHGGHA